MARYCVLAGSLLGGDYVVVSSLFYVTSIVGAAGL